MAAGVGSVVEKLKAITSGCVTAFAFSLLGAATCTAQESLGSGDADRFNEKVNFSLYVLSSGGLPSAGEARFSAAAEHLDLRTIGLPLQWTFHPQALDQDLIVYLRAGYGNATSNVDRNLGGIIGSAGTPFTPQSILSETAHIQTYNVRAGFGLPFDVSMLTPGLKATVYTGGGYMNRLIDTDRASVGPVAVLGDHLRETEDFYILESSATVAYEFGYGGLTVRPVESLEVTSATSWNGKVTQTFAGNVQPANTVARSVYEPTAISHTGLSVRGPANMSIFGHDLLWEGFGTFNYIGKKFGLFPWDTELGAAVGAQLSEEPWYLPHGTLFIGASYIFGPHLTGWTVNLGFPF